MLQPARDTARTPTRSRQASERASCSIGRESTLCSELATHSARGRYDAHLRRGGNGVVVRSSDVWVRIENRFTADEKLLLEQLEMIPLTHIIECPSRQDRVRQEMVRPPNRWVGKVELQKVDLHGGSDRVHRLPWLDTVLALADLDIVAQRSVDYQSRVRGCQTYSVRRIHLLPPLRCPNQLVVTPIRCNLDLLQHGALWQPPPQRTTPTPCAHSASFLISTHTQHVWVTGCVGPRIQHRMILYPKLDDGRAPGTSNEGVFGRHDGTTHRSHKDRLRCDHLENDASVS
mmetsp:Transcript_2171/g.5252  ORF Transcript_2171/g.5252 Transcript_2171/m.5252 type:complete len:288 (-) Transcript_2171:1964-2827(-)